MLDKTRYFLAGQAASASRYVLEQIILGLFSWIPTLVGIGIRSIIYRVIMKTEGKVAIEAGVRILYASGIQLGKGVFLDRGVYLHGLPNGISIGDDSFVMHHSMLHVFNFRQLPQAGISIGKNCFIGEFNVIRGQGGVTIGDGVYTGPMVQIVAVNHVYADPNRPIREQGITARGITIEDDVWLGANVVVVDGVTVGRGSIIGAGSVVTKDIPPYSIAVGSPAKPVKSRHDSKKTSIEEAEVFFGKLEALT
jgi:acetyltransferase-like isoleucine patch superfamily enzyme